MGQLVERAELNVIKVAEPQAHCSSSFGIPPSSVPVTLRMPRLMPLLG